MSDLCTAALAPLLTTRALGRHAFFHDSCTSTNDLAAERGRAGAPHGTLVVSETQTGGRGRMGRAWHSPVGENLYMSILLRPELPPHALPPLTLMVGAALAEALDERVASAGVRVQLKWPNDVLIPGPRGARKLCGVLTEMATVQNRIRHVVVGIGINVNTQSFPDELCETATSLAIVTGQTHDRARVLAAVLNALETHYDRFVAEGLEEAVAAWRRHALFGYRCRVDAARGQAPLEGWARDVDQNGALVVEDDRGERHHVASGEAAAISADWHARDAAVSSRK